MVIEIQLREIVILLFIAMKIQQNQKRQLKGK